MDHRARKLSTLLYIGTVWAERHASAAGVRAWQLLEGFRESGWTCLVASGAADHPAREELEAAGYATHRMAVNDDAFDVFIAGCAPDIVVFDRFMTEEQFSWRVREQVPEALRVLDLVDLHALRDARKLAHDAGRDPMPVVPDATDEKVQRELAAMWRSDVSLVISRAEMPILDRMGLPGTKRIYCPLVYEPSGDPADLAMRTHFVFIGNFRHPPNTDAVCDLHERIWPRIRAALPQAELHVYGAYPPRRFMDLSDEASGFMVKGPSRDPVETLLAGYRVSLAPLAFGAGLKGKILDSCRAGTPVITTPVGAEGIFTLPYPGVAADEASFVASAIELYRHEAVWRAHQVSARETLSAFSPVLLHQGVERLQDIRSDLQAIRGADHTGQAFWQQTQRSSEYFSRWIMAKNRA